MCCIGEGQWWPVRSQKIKNEGGWLIPVKDKMNVSEFRFKRLQVAGPRKGRRQNLTEAVCSWDE